VAQVEALETLVHRLRKKVLGTEVELVTLRGFGYLLRARSDSDSPAP
jgi:two-component system, OmpR family, response regulator TctD